MLKFGRRICSTENLLRLRAAGPSKAGKSAKGSEGPPPPSVDREKREKFVVGANIYKDGTDPELKPDSEYPDWLFSLLDTKPSFGELQRKRLQDLSITELERLVKLENREKIKGRNAIKSKK